jgi:hypothetical protein
MFSPIDLVALFLDTVEHIHEHEPMSDARIQATNAGVVTGWDPRDSFWARLRVSFSAVGCWGHRTGVPMTIWNGRPTCPSGERPKKDRAILIVSAQPAVGVKTRGHEQKILTRPSSSNIGSSARYRHKSQCLETEGI